MYALPTSGNRPCAVCNTGGEAGKPASISGAATCQIGFSREYRAVSGKSPGRRRQRRKGVLGSPRVCGRCPSVDRTWGNTQHRLNRKPAPHRALLLYVEQMGHSGARARSAGIKMTRRSAMRNDFRSNSTDPIFCLRRDRDGKILFDTAKAVAFSTAERVWRSPGRPGNTTARLEKRATQRRE